MRLLHATLALVLGLSIAAARAAEKTGKAAEATAEADAPKTREEAFQRAGVKLTTGPATVPLGKVAELKLPAKYSFVGPDSLDRFYQLTQNMRSGNEVGVVMAPGYMLFFDYDDTGYVKDEEKDKLDGNKLLSAMTEGEDESNAARKKQGWDEMKIKGWATAPHYDTKTNNLKWAINIASSQDGFKEVFINESIRLLGRGGVMNVTLVTGTPGFKAAELDADKLLGSNFSYVSGQKYSEFKAGDKVAAYGLSALVLGGGAVAAAKLGLFAKLGVLFSKFWKAIVFGLIAIGAVFKKVFNKVTGANPESKQSQM
ncbi:MAG TPA: DUF2167 domain-containing protein [Opitutaceae bacterium]